MPTRKTKRTDGRYVATMRYEDPTTGAKRRAYFYGRTQAEVNGRARKARERIAAGSPVRDASRTLGDWLDEWRSTFLAASDRAGATKTLYEGLTRRHVETHIGSIPMDRVKPVDVTRLLLAMERAGVSASTRRNTYAALRGALADAVTNGLLAANPTDKVRRPRSSQREARSLTPAEVTSLLSAAARFRYVAALKVILGTGLRRGEALAMRWQDVNFDPAEVRVRV